MTPDRWQRVKELVRTVCECDGDERVALLDEACQEDPSLRREVESLVQYEDRAGGFLEVPGPGEVAVLLQEHHAERLVGQRIGQFELTRVLGYGGMGLVYQATQEYPHREVALKIVRGSSLIDRHNIQLYGREVRALARLGHPGIAALYEAGSTDDGHHFFAMELVQGVPLNEYARREQLRTPSRLALFCEICAAINYAHQRGVIHRDIKPSNILVDTEGRPKILDFGLAKITDSDITVATMVTETGKIQGTLSYMSPEQARGRSDDIDLRSDVYSLGVVLYELLTDQLPYDLTRTVIPEAVRVICDVPPRKLSTINRTLRGDLETIVRRALEKEPERRYETAAALAEDVRRHLNSQPVLARPPSAVYQLRKLINRHRAPFVLAGLLLLSLTAFAVVGTIQAVRTARERDKAVALREREMEARQAAEQVSGFLVGLFEAANPIKVENAAMTAREVVDKGVARIDRELVDQPLMQARMQHTLGEVLNRLGDYPKARELLEAALATRRRELGDEHLDVAASLTVLALVLSTTDRFEEAEALYREALDIRRAQLGELNDLVAEVLTDLGGACYYNPAKDPAVAADYLRQALDIKRRLHGEEHVDVVAGMNNLAMVLNKIGDHAGAETLLRRALDIERKLLGNVHRSVGFRLENLAHVVFQRGDRVEAEALLREALDVNRKVVTVHG